jgi:hypothetical protein
MMQWRTCTNVLRSYPQYSYRWWRPTFNIYGTYSSNYSYSICM